MDNFAKSKVCQEDSLANATFLLKSEEFREKIEKIKFV